METIYTNATIIARDETLHGTLVVEGEMIKEVDSSIFLGSGAVDLEGEMLLPGLIEMHTDNLEKNIQPRPGVIWPSIMSAAMAHDAQIAGAGITTVFDALAVGGLRQSSLQRCHSKMHRQLEPLTWRLAYSKTSAGEKSRLSQ